MIYGVEEWMEDAECRRATDPDLFFAEGDNAWLSVKAARDYCRRCLVIDECLEYSLKNKIDYGIYAGLTAAERRVLRRKTA